MFSAMDKVLKYIFPLPGLASAEGHQIDMLLYAVHIMILVLFVGWAIFFVYVLVRFRKNRNPRASYPGLRSKFSTNFELGVATVEGILLLGVSIPFWAHGYDKIPRGEEVIQVAVVAEQFAWNFHYPGPDEKLGRSEMKYYDAQTNPLALDPNDPNGKDDFVTVDNMHLPVNRPCKVSLTTKDVIHSFTIPSMRVKQDAIPGMEMKFWFTPVKTGIYDVVCSQLCGMGHYRMRGFLTVEDEEDYQNWIKTAGSPGTSPISKE
jgi:cytochrome c oxidase subunit II